ncbi:MAG TPA: serine/threonine-protein kinase [Sandaracinaceae bacterium]
MRICPTCRAGYPDRGRSTCPKDGARLISPEELDRALNDPLLGQTIAGRFRILGRLGTGGMGTVYRAEQIGLDRHVALKVLKRELVSDRDTVARFHREAKAMSLLVHPNTVRVFDFGEDEGGHLYLAMELLEGELLTAWMEREGTPPLTECAQIAREILRSLAEAHQKGIIHRDLKPDNIFLARIDGHARPVVKVLDFGIAKAFRDDRKIDQLETQAGTVFGTPRYMSPEQAQGKALDHRSDLYSVGVLLYQLVTGRPPFVDDDAVVVMAKHIRETPEPLRVAAPDRPIPRSLEKIVMRALAKDPGQRFESADVFEAKLRACMPEIAEAERTGRASSLRVPLAIGGGILTLAVGVAIAIVATGGSGEAAQARDRARMPPASPAPPGAAAPPAAPTNAALSGEPRGASTAHAVAPVGTAPPDAPPPAAAGVELGVERAPEERATPRRAARRARAARRSEASEPADPPATPAPPLDDDPYERLD